MSFRIGLLINPIAGMGGRVGLKGTDDVADEAVALGAKPIAQRRAGEALQEFQELQSGDGLEIEWLTCAGDMGADCLQSAGFMDVDVIYTPAKRSTREDTAGAVKRFADLRCDLILFCGGDGTARDICDVVGTTIPILGIPSGVKMYSGVFGTTPARTAEILQGFVRGRLKTVQVDVLDLDEARYRKGEWAVRLYHSALTPYEPSFSQAAKQLITEATDAAVKADIAAYLCEMVRDRPDTLFLLGPGSTVQSVAHALAVDKTLLGIDAVAGSRLVASDLNETQILDLLDRYPSFALVLSPIGAQGFVLGRGNLQLSPTVLRKIGLGNIFVIATPAKLARTPIIRFDTGNEELDAALAERRYWPVIIGYRRRRLVKTMV